VKLAVAFALLVVVLVYAHEVGRVQGSQIVGAIDRKFAEIVGTVTDSVRGQ
jgi:hypothetical protein